MNIFDVLSQGKARLHEPSISAMLGYLLDPRANHGLADAFLKEFISLLRKDQRLPAFQDVLTNSFSVDAEILLEEPYDLEGSRKDIDIQVNILDKSQTEVCRIIIENKIRASAANRNQLRDYYGAILEDDAEIQNLYIVFLTPARPSDILKDEFENLEMKASSHHKFWLHWDVQEDGVLDRIRKLLLAEVSANINPINDYARHTMKAFVQHLESRLSVEITGRRRIGEDIGEVVDEKTVNVEGCSYRIIRRDSKQIQVFINDEKIPAKPILRLINREKSLGIDEAGLNTQRLGKCVLDALN